MQKSIHLILVIGLFICSNIIYGQGNLKVADIFGSNMVIQANTAINIWGTGIPGGNVEVQFRDQLKASAVDADGQWKIVLNKAGYGGPDNLIVSSGSEKIVFNNVLAGEVWICSGQSNMEMPLISRWAVVPGFTLEDSNSMGAFIRRGERWY